MITNSPDREQRDKYALKIRAVKTPEVSEREVPVFFYTLYVQDNQQALIGKLISSEFQLIAIEINPLKLSTLCALAKQISYCVFQHPSSLI